MGLQKQYIAIDLKSFYASVECMGRGLDPLDTNLLVADENRTDKTICLAVSPALKSLGIPGRTRLFEARQKVREANALRRTRAPGGVFTGTSCSARELARNPSLEIGFLIAPPRMAHYMEFSRKIVEIYLRHVSYEDMLIYSIDEVFIDATGYLAPRKQTAREFAMLLIHDVLRETGITATAGIGPNLYLAKIAMDVEAKHIPADRNGVRIAELTELSYREKLWDHTPITDFWRVGPGIAKRLAGKGIYTMGDVARCSIGEETEFYNEELLYKLLGVNAELLIDHAWGWEPAEIRDCKAYTPESRSLCSGQVLQEPYPADKCRIVLLEMADAMSLELVRKGLVTNRLVLDIGYDTENVTRPGFAGEIKKDRYGRASPKPAHGSLNLEDYTSSTAAILEGIGRLYDKTVNPEWTVRRLNFTVNNLITPEEAEAQSEDGQLSFFAPPEDLAGKKEKRERERRMQEALIGIRDRYGKNAVIKGISLREGATAIERNGTIGGHKA